MERIAQYWLEAVFGLMLAALSAGYRSLAAKFRQARAAEAAAIAKQKEENAAVKGGMCALLRDRIIQAYNYYVHDKGCCPIYARDSTQAMYEAYHALGGNGMVDDLMEDLLALPTEAKGDE